MKVYAIHKENTFTTDYNVIICSSKKLAEQKLQELNEKYVIWYKEKKYLFDNSFSGYENANYIDWLYRNPTPSKYRVERLEVVTK